jgi:hypothetical protein
MVDAMRPRLLFRAFDPGNPDADRATFMHALADYSMMPVNLLGLGFNVVDSNDNVLTDDEMEKAGLEVRFGYSDETLGAQELPAFNQYGGFMYYNDLWLDKTSFFYQTSMPFIPMRAHLFKKTAAGQKELTTRFSKPKASVANPSKVLDYSAYALAPWLTFDELSGEDIYIALNQNTVYREPLTQSIFLMDNRLDGLSYSVIDSGEWVTGNVSVDDAKAEIAPPEGNGYLEGISAKDAYHITSDLEFNFSGLTNGLPKQIKQLISVVYSSNGMDFFYEPAEGRKPYIQYDNTGQVQLIGVVELPIHVELPNPWQETLAADFTVIIEGQ